MAFSKKHYTAGARPWQHAAVAFRQLKRMARYVAFGTANFTD